MRVVAVLSCEHDYPVIVCGILPCVTSTMPGMYSWKFWVILSAGLSVVNQQRVRNALFMDCLFLPVLLWRVQFSSPYSSSRRFKVRNLCLNQDMVRSSASILVCFIRGWPVLGGSTWVLVTNLAYCF